MIRLCLASVRSPTIEVIVMTRSVWESLMKLFSPLIAHAIN